MRIGKKAEGGFMESIVSMMVVVIALTAFLSLVPMAFAEHDSEREIPKDILNGLRVADGVLISETDMERFTMDNGYSSLKLTISIIGTADVFTIITGDPISDEMMFDSGTLLISVDGRMMNASYELAVWL